jgi:hypothetical protein
MAKTYTRLGDMGEGTALVVHVQDDGDVIIGIGEPLMPKKTVEFCTIGPGGGRSQHTFKALRALAEAVKKDNQECPLEFKGNKFPPKGWGE